MKIITYVMDRLKEPGTMRSLVWVCMSLAGLTITDDSVAQGALFGSTILGLVSAARPEKKS